MYLNAYLPYHVIMSANGLRSHYVHAFWVTCISSHYALQIATPAKLPQCVNCGV